MNKRDILLFAIIAPGVMAGCEKAPPVTNRRNSDCMPGQPGCTIINDTSYLEEQCLSHEQQCAGECFDLCSSTLHCGACDNACPVGQLCIDGACTNACDATLCPTATGNECVVLNDDPNHCGACNTACAEGYICVNAQCVLVCDAQTQCNGACVDLLFDNANCGVCGNICSPDKTCANGVCSCKEGLALCGGDMCIDTTADPKNCGACGVVCANGCEAGQCTGLDGCTETLVVGLSLSEVAVYQAVKIPIMQNLEGIEHDQRNADIVQGRPVVFRVHVTPDADWIPRKVSAHIELTHSVSSAQGDRELFFSYLTPTIASSDRDPKSTFQIDVPAEALTADTQYAITLVECEKDPPAGIAHGARFPSDEFEDLYAQKTGPLRIHLVPLKISEAEAPELTDATIEIYRNRIFAMYPVTEVEFTIGEPLTSSAESMCGHVAAIAARRSEDNASVDLYYFGLTSDISGGQSGCGNVVMKPGANTKTAVGWAAGYAYQSDPKTGASTMCHEIGHLHGRLHAPCNVSDPDRNYPYPNADIGVWGHNLRTDEFLPPTRKDMMSYCPNPDRSLAWLSDYTYQGLLERVAAVNALTEQAFMYKTSKSKVPWRLLVVDHLGAHWSEYPLLVQGTPEGIALTAIVYDRDGQFIQEIEVYKQNLVDDVSQDPYLLTVPKPNPDWFAIEVPGLLAQREFQDE